MPKYYIAILSVLIYGFLFFALSRRKLWLRFIFWPENPTIRLIWGIWLGFLLVIAPLTYHQGDMMNWVGAVESQLNSSVLPDGHAYLPIYAQIHAALLYPLHLIGLDKFTIEVYLIRFLIIGAYSFASGLMVELAPRDKQIAPLVTILAPTTIFFIFWGTNHIVMWALLAAALFLLMQEQYFWAGFAAFAGGYKFLLLPTAITLLIFVFIRKGKAKGIQFLKGASVFLLLNIPYFFFDIERVQLLVSEKANIGSYTNHLDGFHIFYLAGVRWPSFQTWYMEKDIWFFAVGAVCFATLVLYARKKVNTLQGLALSYAAVVLFAPEPFRLEPLLGLLWLDAIAREDRGSQGTTVLIALVYAAFWYQQAYPQILTLAPYSGIILHASERGLYIGAAVLLALIFSLTSKKRFEFLLLDGTAGGYQGATTV